MAKKKEAAPAKSEKPSGPPRFWTPEQRREMFLKSRAEAKEDYQVITSDYQEELIPYGHLVYDHVLGLKGIARHGRVTQIHGDEGAGKSTNTYYIASKYQQYTGEPIGIFDFEATGTVPYLSRMGIDMDLCFFKQPSSVEKAIKDTLDLMDMGVRMFIYDSIPRMKSMVDKKDIKSNKAFKANYGKHAQTMGRFYDLLLPYAIENDCGILMVNQTRDRIDEDAADASKWSYTNRDYVLPGGRICRFTPSVMIELRLLGEMTPIRENDEKTDPFLLESEKVVGHRSPVVNRVRIRTLKSKVTGAGFREGRIYVRPGIGVDEDMSTRELAREYSLINYAGGKAGWYVGKSKDEAIINYATKDEAIEDLVIKKNREVLDKLRGMVAEAIEQDTSNRFAINLSREEQAMFEGAEEVTSDSFEVDVEQA